MGKAPVDFLYTNIGRGHPHYLDGIVSCMPAGTIGASDDVFSLSGGPRRLAWELARLTYRVGSSWSGMQGAYSKFRGRVDYARRGPLKSALGSALIERYTHRTGPLVVAHPLLVGLLYQHSNLVYQHGELAVPAEAVVKGDHRVLVPDERAASVFLRGGVSASKVEVTGLCIEPQLLGIAEKSFHARLSRLSSEGSLGIALFSSGAEPRAHIGALVAAAISIEKEGQRALVFARKDGRLHRATRSGFRLAGLQLDEMFVDDPRPPGVATICLYRTREELNTITVRLFDSFDLLVSPSHERTQWAMGLGLPMLIVDPAIGTFAPLNRDLMIHEGVGLPLDLAAARELGPALDRLRADGKLCAMAEAGWDRYARNGFQTIADMLSRISTADDMEQRAGNQRTPGQD